MGGWCKKCKKVGKEGSGIVRAARKAIMGVAGKGIVKSSRGVSCGSYWEGSYYWRKREEHGESGEAITPALSSLFQFQRV